MTHQITITLSNTEKLILFYLSKGYSQKQIAEKANLSQKTTERTILGLRYRFGCNNVAHLVGYAWENGILKKSDEEL